MDASQPREGLTVVVVAGAGARGAYEAGVMAELLPKICPNGLRNTILLGTSAGAINVALWAARTKPGKSLVEVGEEVKEVWRGIRREAVYTVPLAGYAGTGVAAALDFAHGSVDGVTDVVTNSAAALVSWLPKLPMLPSGDSLVRAAGGAAHSLSDVGFGTAGLLARHPLARTGALLDTSPLATTAKNHVCFKTLHENVRKQALGGVGVVATSCPLDASGGRSRVFLHLADRARVPANEGGSAIDYVSTPRLSVPHVLASAAIPVVFPSVKIREPKAYAGWYTDGGVRLNAPIEPAIKLDADRIVVISSHATEYPDPDNKSAAKASRPEILDIGAQAVHVTLADGMIEDLRLLRRINKMVEDAGAGVLRTEKNRPYKRVAVLEVAPKNGVLSPIAAQVAERVTRAADRSLLRFFSRFGGDSGKNELLSYLLFEPEYYEAQFALGAEHARTALKTQPAFV
jgi:NTE family protein